MLVLFILLVSVGQALTKLERDEVEVLGEELEDVIVNVQGLRGDCELTFSIRNRSRSIR